MLPQDDDIIVISPAPKTPQKRKPNFTSEPIVGFQSLNSDSPVTVQFLFSRP